MSIALTSTLIKRGVLAVLLAGLMFAAGFAVRDTDAEVSSAFIACVSKYTGVMRMSDVEPDFGGRFGAAVPDQSQVNVCQPHEEAWEIIAFPYTPPPTRQGTETAT